MTAGYPDHDSARRDWARLVLVGLEGSRSPGRFDRCSAASSLLLRLSRLSRTPSGQPFKQRSRTEGPIGPLPAGSCNTNCIGSEPWLTFPDPPVGCSASKGEPQVEPDGQHPDRKAPPGRYGAPQTTPTEEVAVADLPQALKSKLSFPAEPFRWRTQHRPGPDDEFLARWPSTAEPTLRPAGAPLPALRAGQVVLLLPARRRRR